MSTASQAESSPRTYLRVLAALLALTAVTVLAAGVNFGAPSINVVIALAIASLKGSLVALYFMHLRHERPMNAVIFLTGMAMLAIFLMFCFLDTASREPVAPSAAPAAQAAGGLRPSSARILRAS
jgi:cytochrome c oxidase subunit 4